MLKKSTEEIVKNAIQGGKYRGFFASFIIFCLFGAIVAVIWYGINLASQGQLLISELFSFILYSAFVGVSFVGVAELYAQIQKAIGSVERVFEILDEKPEILEINTIQTNTKRVEGTVRFQDVAFTACAAWPTRRTPGPCCAAPRRPCYT